MQMYLSNVSTAGGGIGNQTAHFNNFNTLGEGYSTN